MLSVASVRKSKVFRAGQQRLASSWFSLAVLHSFEQLTIAYSCMLAGFFLSSLFAFCFVSGFLIVTLGGPGCSRTCCVDQADLEPEGIHLSLPPLYTRLRHVVPHLTSLLIFKKMDSLGCSD